MTLPNDANPAEGPIAPVTSVSDFDLSPPEHELGRIGWATVPICSVCWLKLYPNRQPVKMINPPVEICYQCLMATQMGIYTRGYAKVVQMMVAKVGLVAIYERYPN